MMSDKFTPGPWRAAGPDGLTVYADGIGGLARVFETSPGGGQKYHEDVERTQADARLMAIAPDLLAACELTEQVIEHLRSFSNATPYIGDAVINELETMVQATIQKARGE